jgi:hypothetical protein
VWAAASVVCEEESGARARAPRDEERNGCGHTEDNEKDGGFFAHGVTRVEDTDGEIDPGTDAPQGNKPLRRGCKTVAAAAETMTEDEVQTKERKAPGDNSERVHSGAWLCGTKAAGARAVTRREAPAQECSGAGTDEGGGTRGTGRTGRGEGAAAAVRAAPVERDTQGWIARRRSYVAGPGEHGEVCLPDGGVFAGSAAQKVASSGASGGA